MGSRRKSFREKLGTPRERVVKRTEKGVMLVPKPTDVDEVMRRVEWGKVTTVKHIGAYLARRFGADYTCPMTLGIFIKIAAYAAEEDFAEGREDITPYWRTLKSDGSLNPKYPGGVEAQAQRLSAEGHEIIPGKGKKPPKVKDFEKKLQMLE